MRRIRGFTLIELLIATTIFSLVLATLFSVLAALQRVERFRDENTVVTQSANLAFEPIIRALKSADATILMRSNNECVTVRGFYGIDSAGAAVFALDTQTNAVTNLPKDRLAGVAVIDTETYTDPQLGQTSRWVKKEYALGPNEVSDTGQTYQTIIETTYHVSQTDAVHQWPRVLDGCTSVIAWQQVASRYLTAKNIEVKDWQIRLAAPLVTESSSALRLAPFASVALTVMSPVKAERTQTARPIRLGTTITPTFSYGEQRD